MGLDVLTLYTLVVIGYIGQQDRLPLDPTGKRRLLQL